MKILVLADTHIPINAKELPEEIYQQAKNVDMIIHAGDIVDLNVLGKLEAFAPVKAVFGNMDSQDARDKLKKKEIIKVGKFRIGIIHGAGAPSGLTEYARKSFKKPIDIIIFGHSHNPVNEYVDGILLFNPGSVTDKIFAPYNSYGILELSDKIHSEIKRLA